MAACFLECVDHIEYAVAFAGSEVVNGNALVVSQFLDGFYMAACQVNNMDVIADTSSVRSIVVITENADALEFSDGNLCDIRKQVVRDALRILSDKAALMRSDRVEVAKQDNIPFRISFLISSLSFVLGPIVHTTFVFFILSQSPFHN